MIIKRESIVNRIRFIRSQKVILDQDLAELYGVETKYLNKMVKRNIKRFPKDFAFRVTQQEFSDLRFQFGTSSLYGGRRYLPFAFTEQGIAMLSSVLNSDTAIKVNIAIMRTFVKINEILRSDIKLTQKIYEIENRLNKLEDKQSNEFTEVYALLNELIQSKESEWTEEDEARSKRPIGFDLSVPEY